VLDQRDLAAVSGGVGCRDQRFGDGEVGEDNLSPGHQGRWGVTASRLGFGGAHEPPTVQSGKFWRSVLRGLPERDDWKVLTSSVVADIKFEPDPWRTPDESLR